MKFIKLDHLKYISVLTVLLSQYCYAQKDYVITNRKDTIYGEIKRHDFAQIKFQESGQELNAVFRANDIKGFYIVDEGDFESVFVPKQNKNVFLQLLEDGIIKLYEFNHTMWIAGSGGGRSVDKFWYAKKDGEVVEIKSNRWYGSRKKRENNFYNLIKENKVLVDQYESDKKFNFDFIRSIIQDYNKNYDK